MHQHIRQDFFKKRKRQKLRTQFLHIWGSRRLFFSDYITVPPIDINGLLILLALYEKFTGFLCILGVIQIKQLGKVGD